jgi:HD-GYP domain-containing protein (c-di-GMP phosphodiesterase class II)
MTSDGRRLYNSRIVDNYIRLLAKKYPDIRISNLLEYAGMTIHEVADEGHWFTQDQIDRFYAKLLELTGNPLIAREAGRYAACPDAMGAMKLFFLGSVGPGKAYGLIGRGARRLTRSSIFESRSLSSNKVEVTVTFEQGVEEKPYQCENRIGFLEAISLLFARTVPNIEHPECLFRGGKTCRYIISWSASKADRFRRARNYAAVFFLPLVILSAMVEPSFGLTQLLPAAMAILATLTSLCLALEKKDITASLNGLCNSTHQLVNQIEMNHNNAVLTSEIGQSISGRSGSVDVLSSVVKACKKWLDYDRCMILLADSGKKRLVFGAGYGHDERQIKLLRQTAFHLDKPGSRGVFVICFKQQKSFLVSNLEEIEKDLSLKSMSYAEALGAESFICCPIVSNGESIGVLAVDNVKTKRPLIETDRSLLIGVACVVGISLRSEELLKSKDRQFRSILHGLAASIDARDPLTRGHSEKVTEYTVGICDELGFSPEQREVISTAALLHDYGKLAVPDAILRKPGRLTPRERELVKIHAEQTERILRQISFEGIYRQVPAIAGAHHEKIDGSGYPRGLKGEAIPLGARIIAVADVFEAITAKRHYHEPIRREEAIALLKREAGRSFEPHLVDAFLRYYERAYPAQIELEAPVSAQSPGETPAPKTPIALLSEQPPEETPAPKTPVALWSA